MAFQRFPTRNLQLQIAEEIASRIFRGIYPPGTILPNEFEWVKTFDVSRTALREALRLLTAKGMIDSRPRRGTIVRDKADWTTLDADMLRWMQHVMPTAEFVSHVMTMRRIIEPEAAALCATRSTAHQVAELRVLAETIDQLGQRLDNALTADVGFHRLILVASGNPLLAGLAACIEEALKATIALTMLSAGGRERTDARWRAAMAGHCAVVDAIEQRSAAGARTAMQDLLAVTEEDVRAVLAEKQM